MQGVLLRVSLRRDRKGVCSPKKPVYFQTNPQERHVPRELLTGLLVILLPSSEQLTLIANVLDFGRVLERSNSDSGKREGRMEGRLQGQKWCFEMGAVLRGRLRSTRHCVLANTTHGGSGWSQD